jgi:hypothetical protein
MWKFKERIPAFLEIVTAALSPYVDGFILGIETNRGPLDTPEKEYGLKFIKQFAFRMIDGKRVYLPVGTHEQNISRDGNDRLFIKSPILSEAMFVGYETMNHPFDGYKVSIARMVEEVTFLVANSGGRPVWVMESNEKEDDYARKQNQALANIPGVVGVNCPL